MSTYEKIDVTKLVSLTEKTGTFGRPELFMVCRGHDDIAVVLNYFLYEACKEITYKKLDTETIEFVSIKRTLDDIMAGIHNTVSKKTLISYIKKLQEWEFIHAHSYRQQYDVYFKHVDAAVKNPPEADVKKPRGKRPTKQDCKITISTILPKNGQFTAEDIVNLSNQIVNLQSQMVDLQFEVVKLQSQIVNLQSSNSDEVNAQAKPVAKKQTPKNTKNNTKNIQEQEREGERKTFSTAIADAAPSQSSFLSSEKREDTPTETLQEARNPGGVILQEQHVGNNHDAPTVTPKAKPAMPPTDAVWNTRTCIQMFDAWRGVPLMAKYKLQQASGTCKALAENYTREQVEQTYERMSNDPFWIARGGPDFDNVANNIARELKKLARTPQASPKPIVDMIEWKGQRMSKEEARKLGYTGFEKYVGNGPEDLKKIDDMIANSPEMQAMMQEMMEA